MRKEQLKPGMVVWAHTSTWGDYVGEVLELEGSPARVTFRVVNVAKPPISTTMSPRYPFKMGSQHDVGITNVHPLDELKAQLGQWRRGGYKGLMTDVEYKKVLGIGKQGKENRMQRTRKGVSAETTKIVGVEKFVDNLMKYRARVVKLHVWLKNVSNVVLRKDRWEYMAWEVNNIHPPFTINIYESLADVDRPVNQQTGNVFNITAPSFSKIEAFFHPALPDDTTIMVLDPTRTIEY